VSRIAGISSKEFLILNLLVEKANEMYGLELVAASGGELKRGTVYVTLERMEVKQLVECRKVVDEHTGVSRVQYRATVAGVAFYHALKLRSARRRVEVVE
jgi:DNA-binding PadR family transcriptional regulator